MLYEAYQSCEDMTLPLKSAGRVGLALLSRPDLWGFGEWGFRDSGVGLSPRPMGQALDQTLVGRHMAAAFHMMARTGLTHSRPDYQIRDVLVGNDSSPVTEEVSLALPFGHLLHFVKEVQTPQPRVLVVAPLSGHFATLLRSTVRTLLVDHDVYVTDWVNARDVSLDEGAFGFDDYVDYLMRFLRHLGPGTHVVAVCQPCVQALAATALMSEDDDPATPASLTLMAGPVDTRIHPTKVNELAKGKPLDWFEKNLIARVPLRYPGAMRRVYPGFLQLSAFVSMNFDRHVKAHEALYQALTINDSEKIRQTEDFYD
jgi:polyhydroxyalkanoate depolymerase